MDAGHCQICGRLIRCPSGRLAAHGFKRPWKQGYQTRSCEGAGYAPYEVSATRIPFAIDNRLDGVCHLEALMAARMQSPPMEAHRLDAYGRVRATYVCPKDFDPVACMASPSQPVGYGSTFRALQSDMAAEVKALRADVEYLRARLAAWVPPAAEG